jgi:hypothetical protein
MTQVESAWAAAIARHLSREIRPQDRIVIPCSERFTLNCLRWQLLPFAEQVCRPTEIDWPRLERSGGRLWFIDQMVEQAPAIQEPPVRDPREISPQMKRANWQDIRRVRFLVHESKSSTQQVFHYCCDMHVFSHALQSDSNARMNEVLVTFRRSTVPGQSLRAFADRDAAAADPDQSKSNIRPCAHR